MAFSTLAAAVASGSALGQEIAGVYLFKGETFSQTSAAAPSPAANNPFTFWNEDLSGLKSGVIAGPTVKGPGASVSRTLTSTTSQTDPYFQYRESFPSLDALTAAWGAGAYTVTYTGSFSGAKTINVNFPAGTIPAAPIISNWTAAQSIDPTADFDVQWTVAGASAADMIEISIADNAGNVIASSPPVGPSGTLDGTTASFTIDADSLEAGTSYTATITYYKAPVTVLTGLPFTMTAYYSQTEATIKTAGSVVADTTPPTLVESAPPDDLILPITNFFNFPASFKFSEKMSTDIAIEWGSAIDGSKVQYQWLPDGATPNVTLLATYPNGWPAHAHITWTLNPNAAGATNFKDAAGNPLAASAYTGGFLTGPGDSSSVCEGADAVLGANFGIVKTINNYENHLGNLVADTNAPVTFKAFYNPTNQTELSLTTLQIASIHKLDSLIPNGSPIDYTRYFSETNATVDGIDAAYPATTYQMQRRDTSVNIVASADLTVGAGAGSYPPAPRFTNLPQAAPDLTQNFTVSWTPFADEANNGLTTLEVFDGSSNLVYRLPDACQGLTLAPGSGSAVIPASVFSPSIGGGDTNYTFVLTFYKFTDQNKPLAGLPGQGFAALSQRTAVSLNPKDDVPLPEPPNLHHFLGVSGSPEGLQFQFSAWAGSNYVLEAAANLNPPTIWSVVQMAQSSSQILQIADAQWLQFPQRFYRIRMIDGALPTLTTNGIALLDTARAAAGVIDDNGGDLSLSNLSGDFFSFHLEPLELASYEDVTMTLLENLQPFPLSGGFVGGVEFSPADVPLLTGGTLSLQFANQSVPPNLAAVGYHIADGSYFLLPVTVSSNTASVPVVAFGGIAFGIWNPADAAYFQTNNPPATPEGILQTMALATLPQTAPSAKKSGVAASGDPTPILQILFETDIYQQMLATQDGNDIVAMQSALSGFVRWYNQCVDLHVIQNMGTQIDEGNTVAKVAINNYAQLLFDKALQHDFDALMWLQNLAYLIQHEPWAHTWIPGAGEDLLDQANRLRHFTVDLDSTIDWATAAGPVHSEVKSSIPYRPEDHPIKGTVPMTWVSHTHYQPAPCSVVASLDPGTVSAYEIGFKVKRPRNKTEKFILLQLRYVFWPDGVNENDEVICPYGSGGPIQYWWPTFGYAHKDALIGYTFKGMSPRAGYDIRGGWTITQTGSANMATRDFSGTFPFKDGTATESSHFILRHTPNQ